MSYHEPTTIKEWHAKHAEHYNPIKEGLLKGVRVGPWQPDPEADYCALRCVEGGDPNNAADRVAFIEKTPRVRVNNRLDQGDAWKDGYARSDHKNWVQGNKGSDYGADPDSRAWCDEMLRQMGAVLVDEEEL